MFYHQSDAGPRARAHDFYRDNLVVVVFFFLQSKGRLTKSNLDRGLGNLWTSISLPKCVSMALVVSAWLSRDFWCVMFSSWAKHAFRARAFDFDDFIMHCDVLYSYLTNLVRLRGSVYTKQNLFFVYFQAVDREKGGKKGKKGKKSGKKSGKKARFWNFSKQ